MAVYAYLCPNGHSFTKDRSMKERMLGVCPCSLCGEQARQDYSAYKPLPPIVDGETSGFYGKSFPRDPQNPAKHIVPNKNAWREHCKRNNLTDMS